MNTEIVNLLISFGSGAVAWIASKKWIFPMIGKAWGWFKGEAKEYHENNINASKEIAEIKDKSNNVYESQIEFLMKQITSLEDQLAKHSQQLDELRNKIVELNNKLFQKSMKISELREMSCCVSDCKFRVLCTNNKEEENESINKKDI